MIEPFRIENQSEADAFLRDLLAKPEYRFMAEVEHRARELILDGQLRKYFIDKAHEILQG